MINIYADYEHVLKLIATTEKAIEDSQTQDIFLPGYGVADAFVMLGRLKQDAKIKKPLVDAERREVCSKCVCSTKKPCAFFNDDTPLEMDGAGEYLMKCYFPRSRK